ncbi:MAG TPA: HD domain-containing protein, partial [Phycisphaerae bacterium]|nr:HD domain-containing protein [Phycisphaerae bacterium]
MATSPNNVEANKTVAVIDVGSNSVWMVVAQVPPSGPVEPLEQMRRPVHLGRDTFVAGRLGQRTMNAAIGVLRDYRKVLDGYRVAEVRAVATSAVREAANADAFLDRVFMTTGLDVEIIEPAEESRLIVGAALEGVGEALDLAGSQTLIADVGGGSALLSVLRGGEILATGTYRLGSIRLQEVLATAHEPAERAAAILRHEIDSVMVSIRSSLPLKEVASFIAIGGDARVAARAVGSDAAAPGLHVIPAERFDRFVRQCAGRPADKLTGAFGIAFADAETLVPALLAYEALLHETRATEMIVADVSMRDGLLLDLTRQARGQEDTALTGSIVRAARSIGEKYHYDEPHAAHVAELAGRIFDALRADHGLGPRERLQLQLAAILHDIGGYVSTRAHHKHSYYLVANSEVFGLRREERMVVALLARYHRRSGP